MEKSSRALFLDAKCRLGFRRQFCEVKSHFFSLCVHPAISDDYLTKHGCHNLVKHGFYNLVKRGVTTWSSMVFSVYEAVPSVNIYGYGFVSWFQCGQMVAWDILRQLTEISLTNFEKVLNMPINN